MKTMNELFREVIMKNELGDDVDLAFSFSDPDGVRSGKSGWSFGVCQFDTKNNELATKCLVDCGFTDAEIDGIVSQKIIDIKPFSKRLRDHADIIAQYDTIQLSSCLVSTSRFNEKFKLPITDKSTILAQADYVNQYGSMGNGFAGYLKLIPRPTALDILNFKLKHTKYGREHPEDCKRRYKNLIAVLAENNAC